MYLSHRQYTTRLSQKLQGWLRRKARRLPEAWHEAARVLLRLDLDSARPLLRALYAPGPRGRPPYDPVCVLRAFLLMLLLHYKSLPQWADDLRTHPRLAQIAGFAPFATPAVGTFYAFIDRLEDGPYTLRAPIASAPAASGRDAIGVISSRNKRTGTPHRPALPCKPIPSLNAWPRS